MAKYDSQLTEVKNLLPNAKNILIALPAGADIDKFASGLALFLAFEAQGRQVQIVSEDTIRVVQANLFGVDHIKNSVSSSGGGDLTIVLEGVVDSNGTVPALEKLDWHPDGQNLNLDFHAVSGQSFKPVNITPKYGGGGFDLIFTIGAANLNSLGNIYIQNNQIFSGGHLINIDSQALNTNFGKTNIVDSNTSSISEIMTDMIPSLGLPFDSDIASNLLAGIFNATSSLSNEKVMADTYLAVAQCLRVGGKKPFDFSSATSTSFSTGSFTAGTQGKPVSTENSGLDLSSLFPSGAFQSSSASDFPVPRVVPPQNSQPTVNPAPSAEERPYQEGLNSADSIEVEPGWLTPKVFKGTSAG